MPRRPSTETAEDRAIREVDAEDEAAMKHLAAEAGPPPDSEQLSDRDLDEIYAIEDRAVSSDPDGFAQRLMTTGLDQPTLATLRVVKEHPEWMPFYAQPTQDAEMADRLTRLAQFPHRWALLADIDDPEEQARTAERLDRRYQKAHAERLAGFEQATVEMPAMPTDAGADMPMPTTPEPPDGYAGTEQTTMQGEQ